MSIEQKLQILIETKFSEIHLLHCTETRYKQSGIISKSETAQGYISAARTGTCFILLTNTDIFLDSLSRFVTRQSILTHYIPPNQAILLKEVHR